MMAPVHRGCLSTAILSLKQGSSQEEERARREDSPSSSRLSTLEKIQMQKNPVTIYQHQGRWHHQNWTYDQDAVYCLVHKIKDYDFGKQNVARYSYTILCRQIVSTR